MSASASTAGLRVVVTGGLGQLGRAVGAVLAAQGARVVLLDRAPDTTVAGMAAVIGGVDLADAASAAAGFDRATQALGGLDGLVNVAGGFAWQAFEGGSLDTWDRQYAMNLRTAVVATQAALPHLLQTADAGGPAAIVNVAAGTALKAGIGTGAYAASKAGVMRLTEALAEEFKQRGLRVNAVLPSILDTPANRADMPEADPSRWVAPEALGEVIAFLLSPQAGALTGANLPVNGRV